MPGAPRDVTTKAHEKTRLRNYLDLVREGADGWEWYEKGGRAVMFAANDDPAFARQFAESLAITSPQAAVLSNSGFGVKGVMQARGGVPVQTGKYPAAMSPQIEEVFANEAVATGLKRGPFNDALARGGGFKSQYTPERPVNDIWQGEAWGYQNADGTPLRRGWTAAEHAWMDRMSDRALRAVLNDPTLAAVIPPDKGPWTLSRLQAAAWVGSKRRAEKAAIAAAVAKGSPIKSSGVVGQVGEFGPGIERTYAQGGREFVAGKTTKHLQGISPEDQAALDRSILTESGIYDPKMRDQIMAGYGGLTGEAIRGPGFYKGVASPGVQTQTPVGSVEVPGLGRELDAGSMRLLRASENTYALLTAQDAAAGGRVLEAAPGVRKDGARFTFKSGKVNDQQMLDVYQRILQHGGSADSVAQIFTPNGLVLYNLPTAYGGMPDAAFDALVKDVQKAYGTPGGMMRGRWSGFYDPNDWRKVTGKYGQGYYGPIEPFKERFDLLAPPMAQNMIGLEAQLKRLSKGRFDPAAQQEYLRKTIANEGFRGLKRLAREFGVPVALLAVVAGVTAQDGEEPGQ